MATGKAALNSQSKGSHSDESEQWGEQLKKLIDVFKPFLLETLKVSHLLCLLHIEEVKKKASEIHQLENNGKSEDAAKLLLAAIEESEEPGKWPMFIDALVQVKDTVILRTLLGEKEHLYDPWLDDQQNRKLIHLFGPKIVKHLRLEALLPKMIENELILPQDEEQLRSQLSQNKTQDANVMLLFLMHRHNHEWYKIFLTILFEFDEHHLELAKIIDPEFCEKKSEKMKEAEFSSLEVNLGKTSALIEKRFNTKTFSQVGATPPHEYPGSVASNPWETTCDCKCCGKLLTEVTSLKSELAEIKNLLKCIVPSKESVFH